MSGKKLDFCDKKTTIKTVNNEFEFEHQDVRKTSETAKHLCEYPDHMFEWKCLLNMSHNGQQRKNIEASFIAILGPTLINQLNTKKLILFHDKVTWQIDHAFKLMYIYNAYKYPNAD